MQLVSQGSTEQGVSSSVLVGHNCAILSLGPVFVQLVCLDPSAPRVSIIPFWFCESNFNGLQYSQLALVWNLKTCKPRKLDEGNIKLG